VVARELVYAPLPIENQASVVNSHTPMIQYLVEKLGVTIRIRYENDNNRTLQLFKEGKIDLIQLGPLPYVILKKNMPAPCRWLFLMKQMEILSMPAPCSPV